MFVRMFVRTNFIFKIHFKFKVSHRKVAYNTTIFLAPKSLNFKAQKAHNNCHSHKLYKFQKNLCTQFIRSQNFPNQKHVMNRYLGNFECTINFELAFNLITTWQI